MQLISPMLGNENAPRGVDGKASAIPYPRGEPVGRRKLLIRFVGVVTPYAAPSLQFGTRVRAGYIGLTVFRLAGVGRGTHVYIHRSFWTDDLLLHGTATTKR